ncbi:MAG: chitosanase, partial [Candidatus Kapaibacterium sp.]
MNKISQLRQHRRPYRVDWFAPLFGLLLASFLSGCGGDNPVVRDRSTIEFTSEQRRVADQIVSLFENDTTAIQYGYAENINDGRGITAGRAGFTTATGDLLLVVERYTNVVPANGLAQYLPRLRELADAESGSTSGLEGLEVAWKKGAEDSIFRLIQDSVVDE